MAALVILAVVVILFWDRGVLGGQGSLKYPLPKQDQRVIEQAIDKFINENIFDIQWDDFYRYSTQFPSLDGFFVLGSSTVNGIGVQMESPGTGAGGTALVQKFDVLPTSFKSPSRIRAMIQVATTTGQHILVVVGNPTTDAYGFFIDDNILFGLAQTANTASTTIEIQTLTKDKWYLIDARYEPNNLIRYFVAEDGDDVANQIVLKGVIRTNLPTATNFNGLFVSEVVETEAFVKVFNISFYEYMQKRFIQ